jgi:hypothetical protein
VNALTFVPRSINEALIPLGSYKVVAVVLAGIASSIAFIILIKTLVQKILYGSADQSGADGPRELTQEERLQRLVREAELANQIASASRSARSASLSIRDRAMQSSHVAVPRASIASRASSLGGNVIHAGRGGQSGSIENSVDGIASVLNREPSVRR